MNPSSFSKRLADVFSIDVRSLALVRIALAIIVLQDLVRRSFDIAIFYGDGGVLPVSYTQMFWNGSWAWSLHLMGGGPTWLVAALFVVHALAALALLFGFYTKTATVLTWFLVVSLHNANNLILQGEDVLLRAVLFVAMFLPLGAVYSIDRWRTWSPNTRTVLSGWSVAYLLQLGFLYFFVSIYKHSAEWMNGSAIYFALSIDQYATTFGKYLLNFPEILTFVTIAVLIFQSFALFLLFSPVYTTLVRTVTVLLLMLMHAGFALSMHLGMFSAVSIAALCGFLPSRVWDVFENFLTTRVSALGTWVSSLSVDVRDMPSSTFSRTRAAMSVLGVCYIFYIFFWHSGNVLNPGQYVPFTHGFELPAKILHLDQRWSLFAPYPYRDDGWVVIAAKQANGQEVDLFKNGTALSYERPDVIYDLYPRPRWRRYFLSLRQEGSARYRVPLAEYLCKQWNDTHESDSHITTLEITYMLEWTPLPGEPMQPVRPVSLLAWDCDRHVARESAIVR